MFAKLQILIFKVNNFTSLKGIENLYSLEYLRIDIRFRDFPKDLDRIIALNLIEIGQDSNSIEYRKKLDQQLKEKKI